MDAEFDPAGSVHGVPFSVELPLDLEPDVVDVSLEGDVDVGVGDPSSPAPVAAVGLDSGDDSVEVGVADADPTARKSVKSKQGCY